MRIEIISTGDEVITGSIDDTNASFLSRELIDAGLQVERRHTTGDSLSELMAVFTEVSERNAVAIVTGGLGPTNDDLTTEAIARVAGVPLELNEPWFERMSSWFKQRGRTMAPSNMKQAMLPQGALCINNPVGTACGFVIKVGKAIFIFAPGVPKELKAMWESQIKEMVISFTKDSVPRTHLIRFFLMGIGESDLMEKLGNIKMPEGITIGDRAIYPLIELKIIGHDANDNDMFQVLSEVMQVVAPYYVCRDSYSLIDILNQKEIKLNPINAIDGCCRGWFLIHLQELCTNFIICSVLNTDPSLVSDADLALEDKLISHIPGDNQIELMPYNGTEEALKEEQAANYPYRYQLSFDLKFTEQEQEEHISGKYVIGFKEIISNAGNYTRNRDFLAHLCIAELYKTLARESLIKPDQCLVSVLEQHDSRAKS